MTVSAEALRLPSRLRRSASLYLGSIWDGGTYSVTSLAVAISRESSLFARSAVRAKKAFNLALETFETFSAVGAEGEAEQERQDAHASLDAYCDAIRSAHKALGGI